MEFYTCSNEARPVRLSEQTRQFAWDSLHHRYGLDTVKTPGVVLDSVPGYASLPIMDRYDLAIRKIAEEAPLRICDGEKLSGAATLGSAISHLVPALYQGKAICRSYSHLTVDFEIVLTRGFNGIARDVESSLLQHTDPEKRRFLESCRSVIQSLRIYRDRYLAALHEDSRYQANYDNLLRVPFEPARHFYEAVQSIWFTFSFLRLCGDWPGIGRLDWLLGSYLKQDLAAGLLTLEEAREILAHFFIKGCEWICGGDYGSGDAQHYQNIVLSGTDAEGQDITNEVSYLVLDIIEELGISDFPISIRLHAGTEEKLLRRAAEVVKFGGGILAFYNEATVLKALREYGYPEEDAWKFANDGCWEVQIPGKTCFSYRPFDALQILQHTTLRDYAPGVCFCSFEELYAHFTADMTEFLRKLSLTIRDNLFCPREGSQPWVWQFKRPCTTVSLLEEGCIKKGLPYNMGGPIYNVKSPHIGGFPDVVNSLYAIKKLVFDDKKCTFAQLMQILADNWQGAEVLRLYAKNHYTYYGNGNQEADQLAARVLEDFAAACQGMEGSCGYSFPAGASTFGRQLEWAPNRFACPDGFFAHEVLASNSSPTPGTDTAGALAILRSYCAADLSRMVTGAALDLKLLPSHVEGEDGTHAIAGLLRGFVALGGCFIQPDVADKEILRQAQRHPEQYQTLSVRVSGWNARFVTLNRDWQDMMIDENR